MEIVVSVMGLHAVAYELGGEGGRPQVPGCTGVSKRPPQDGGIFISMIIYATVQS